MNGSDKSTINREGAWSIGDQVLSSGTNFVPSLLLARLLGPADFGAFSIAFLAWFGCLSILKSSLMQPYTLSASGVELDDWRDLTGKAAGAVALSGGVIGVVLAFTAAAVDSGPMRSAFLILALLAPALALQEFWRAASFASRRAKTATANDACWALVQLFAFGGLAIARVNLTVTESLLGWGVGAVAGAVLGSLQLSIRPSFTTATARWARSVGAIGMWFTLSTATLAIGLQCVAFIVVREAGSDGMGLYRAVQNLFGPIQLLTIGLEAVFLPHVVRSNAIDPRGLRRGVRYSVAVAGSVAIYGLVLAVGAHPVLDSVFGRSYSSAAVLVAPLAIAFMLDAAGSGASIELRARGLGRQLLASQVAANSARVVAVFVLGATWGLRGAAWGLALGSLIGTASWWHFVLRSSKARRASLPELVDLESEGAQLGQPYVWAVAIDGSE